MCICSYVYMHVYIHMYIHTWLTARWISPELWKKRNRRSRWGRKRTSKTLLRSTKRNWFENRSYFCSTGNVLIFTSPATPGSDFLDPRVTKALTAFVLDFLSQALYTAEPWVSPSSSVWHPNRECNSFRHTGALTLHWWSFDLRYLLFHQTKSECSWPLS